ncbi:hypothetical protein [Streptomyces sp. WAC00288]|nr:hypothetical protein [Streptomyces sp. WAC00288]
MAIDDVTFTVSFVADQVAPSSDSSDAGQEVRIAVDQQAPPRPHM